MLTTTTNVPPEFQASFNAVVTQTAGSPGDAVPTRVRRKARHPPRERSTTPLRAEMRAIANMIANLLGLTPDTNDTNQFAYGLTNQLAKGQIDQDYFLLCVQAQEDFLDDEPDSIPDPDPPPYSYRVPENLPTRPTYHAGSPAAGPAAYQGFLTAGFFHDTRLTWSRRTWQIFTKLKPNGTLPLIHRYIGAINITTNRRGSRPMCSVISKPLIATIESATFDTAETPTLKPRSYYWRYHPPVVTAPYYTATQPVRIISNINRRKYFVANEPADSVTILSAPRPMFGRGQNNCDSVDTILDGDEDVIELQPHLDERGPVTMKYTFYHLGQGPQFDRDIYAPAGTSIWKNMRQYLLDNTGDVYYGPTATYVGAPTFTLEHWHADTEEGHGMSHNQYIEFSDRPDQNRIYALNTLLWLHPAA